MVNWPEMMHLGLQLKNTITPSTSCDSLKGHMSPLTDAEIDAIIQLRPFPDENSPLFGLFEWLRRMAAEIKELRTVVAEARISWPS